MSLWWQIQLDPKNRVHDDQFRSKSDAVIAAIEAWTEREPKRGEAWFYLGGAYGARAQWRVLREERIAAARDGKRIKNALEQALALDPSLNDAYFGIGLYHYYADVAPAAFRMLRWVLLLPGGDRLEGMREMLRARSEGQLLQSEADYQLHLIYLWYEKQPANAPYRGYAWGLSIGVRPDDAGPNDTNTRAGEVGWAGLAGTYYFINPRHNVAAVAMSQYACDSTPVVHELTSSLFTP